MVDKISGSSKRKQSTLSPSSPRRSKRRSKISYPDSYSDDSDSQITLPVRRSKHSRRSSNRSGSRRRRRWSVSSERGDYDESRSDDEDDGVEEEDRRRKSKRSSSSSRNISKEEIAEYVTNRAQKKALKVSKKLKMQNVSGYSNDANPFGDANLNERFVWRKKIDRDVTHGATLDAFSVKSEKRQGERMV